MKIRYFSGEVFNLKNVIETSHAGSEDRQRWLRNESFQELDVSAKMQPETVNMNVPAQWNWSDVTFFSWPKIQKIQEYILLRGHSR